VTIEETSGIIGNGWRRSQGQNPRSPTVPI